MMNTKKLSDYSINTDWAFICQMLFWIQFRKKVSRSAELVTAGIQGLVHRLSQFGQVYGLYKQLADAQAAGLLG